MGDRVIGENPGKHEPQNTHDYERIQERPEDAQRHVAVADLEILDHQLAKKEEVIASPAQARRLAPAGWNLG
jgi:hypothetical protein